MHDLPSRVILSQQLTLTPAPSPSTAEQHQKWAKRILAEGLMEPVRIENRHGPPSPVVPLSCLTVPLSLSSLSFLMAAFQSTNGRVSEQCRWSSEYHIRQNLSRRILQTPHHPFSPQYRFRRPSLRSTSLRLHLR